MIEFCSLASSYAHGRCRQQKRTAWKRRRCVDSKSTKRRRTGHIKFGDLGTDKAQCLFVKAVLLRTPPKMAPEDLVKFSVFFMWGWGGVGWGQVLTFM
jgi:hypothetical protein